MILVTGGTGLLGTHLILALHALGLPVRAIYRSEIPAVIKDKAEWIKGDILDVISLETAMEQITEVYHVAGFVSFHKKHLQKLSEINIEGTANVVNACLNASVRKMVHVSSVAAVGRKKNNVVSEHIPWTAETSNSAYSRSKFLGEMEVWRGIGEGLNAAIVNPTIIFGEHGDWTKGSMNIFRNIYNGFPWYSGGASGFVDADDVAKAMICLMQSDVSGERFLLNGENRSFSDIFFMIADAFGIKRPYKKVSPLIAAIVWRLEKIRSVFSGKDPMITKETAHTSLSVVTIDNQKFLATVPGFNYQPLQKSIERICRNLRTFYRLES
ncbi:MAG: NAD-dependent epimerase/dehydratase family protein [Bacteroidota bacterium]